MLGSRPSSGLADGLQCGGQSLRKGSVYRVFAMHHASLSAYAASLRQRQPRGPIALMLIEDDVEVESTIAHHQRMGFGEMAAVCAPEMGLPDEMLHRVDFDLREENALQSIVNAVIPAVPGTWLYFCFNAEYLFFPFCEDRSLPEMLAFMTEERRTSVFSTVVDLYAGDLRAQPRGVDREEALFDGAGYYSLPRKDPDGAELERQIHIHGGLRWRFENHIAEERQSCDRIALFQAAKGLKMLPDRSFSIAEYNTYACPWHNNVTAAVASFRSAKALCRNPGSREEITTFRWPRSTRFDWHSQQLLDLGIIEPGQWF
ncbi:MAG: hypothetical protein AAFU41_04710 [Pseudomonadota bacterium]